MWSTEGQILKGILVSKGAHHWAVLFSVMPIYFKTHWARSFENTFTPSVPFAPYMTSTALCFEMKTQVHLFHHFFPPFSSTALLHFHTNRASLLRGHVGMASTVQMCPASRTGTTLPTCRAVPRLDCEIARCHQDTAGFTYAH